MRKVVVFCLLAALFAGFCPTKAEAADTRREPGGAPAFLIGCCLGLRVGLEWNEGADVHWREWCSLIPGVSAVMAVWSGIDCANGMTAHQWAEQNGANWY